MNKFWTQFRSFFSRRPLIMIGTIYVVLTLVIFSRIFFTGGVPGLRHDWFIPVDSQGLAEWFHQALYPWISARGGYPMPYWSDLIIRLLIGPLGIFGVSGSLTAKILLGVVIIGSGLGSYIFIKKITSSGTFPAFIGSLFYTLNPLVYNKIVAGHTYYLLAYALAPLFLWLVLDLTEKKSLTWRSRSHWQKIIIAGLVLALTGVQLQFPPLLVVLTVVLVWATGRAWRSWLLVILPVLLTCLVLHLPWLINFIVGSLFYHSQIASTPATFDWFVHNSSQLYQAFFLLGGGNDYWSAWLQQNHIYIPWLVFASVGLIIIWLKTGASTSLSFRLFLIYLASILVLCLCYLFPQSTWWLFQRSIIFNIFREVYHLTFFVALLFSLLTTLALSAVSARRVYQFISISFIVLYAAPFLAGGDLGGNISNFQPDISWQSWLHGQSRTLFLPSLQPLSWTGSSHSGADPEIYYSPGTSLSQMGYYGTLNERFATFIQSQIYFAPDQLSAGFTQMLSVLGVKNVIYRPDFSSDIVRYTHLFSYPAKNRLINNQTISDLLGNFTDKIISTASGWQFYQFADEGAAKISMPASCLVAGNWSDLHGIFQLSRGYACQGAIFAKDVFYRNISQLPVIINHGSWPDLLLLNPANQVIEPGVYATDGMDPAASWVSAEHSWWYHPLLAGYPKLFAFSTTTATLKIPADALPDSRWHVWAEVFHHPDGGEINFDYRSWQKIINTRSLTSGWQWQDLGEVNFEQTGALSVVNQTGDNAVGQILFIPADQSDDQIHQLVAYLQSAAKLILYQPSQTADTAWLNFDLKNYSHFYPNFPEFSQYKINADEQQVEIEASFSGPADQDEFASLIYPIKFDTHSTPFLTFFTKLDRPASQFWEVGLEIDENMDGEADTVIWRRVQPGQTILDINQELIDAEFALPFDQVDLVGLRFQPHKEYGVDMMTEVQSDFKFLLSDVKFHTRPDQVVRLPRLADQIDLTKLTAFPAQKIDLKSKVDFYNDFPDTEQELVRPDDASFNIKSEFTDDESAVEYSKLVINTEIDLTLYPYFSADLGVDDPELQFFEVSFGVDSDHDNAIDQILTTDPVLFTSGQNETVFYDIYNLLQRQTKQYIQPRVLTIEFIAHKAYQLNGPVHPVVFRLEQLNIYHEAALNQALRQPLPTFANTVNVPRAGEYEIFLNLESDFSQTLYGQINQQNFAYDLPENLHDWINVGRFSLLSGDNQLILLGYDRPILVHQIAILQGYQPSAAPGEISHITADSPVDYTADARLDQPGLVLFKESYHPAWQLTAVNQSTGQSTVLHPVLVNGWQQGYFFDQPGEYSLRFHYELADIYRPVLIVSIIWLGLNLVNVVIYCIIKLNTGTKQII